MFLIIFLLFFLSNINISYSEVFFVLPDKMSTTDVNKGMKKKTMNRNENVMYQMNNQYKGKLKYRPTNNMVKNFRKGRYYTSVYYSHTDLEISKITSNRIEYEDSDKERKFNDYFGAAFGVYLRNSIGAEIEYFEYKKDITTTITNYKDNFFEFAGQNYFLNFFVESNYSKIIPFLGVGGGILRGNIKNAFSSGYFPELILESYSNVIEREDKLKKPKLIPVFQFFAGFEFALTDDLTFFARYKYYSLKKDIITKRIIKEDNLKLEQNFNFTFKGKSFINIGFKYLW